MRSRNGATVSSGAGGGAGTSSNATPSSPVIPLIASSGLPNRAPSTAAAGSPRWGGATQDLGRRVKYLCALLAVVAVAVVLYRSGPLRKAARASSKAASSALTDKVLEYRPKAVTAWMEEGRQEIDDRFETTGGALEGDSEDFGEDDDEDDRTLFERMFQPFAQLSFSDVFTQSESDLEPSEAKPGEDLEAYPRESNRDPEPVAELQNEQTLEVEPSFLADPVLPFDNTPLPVTLPEFSPYERSPIPHEGAIPVCVISTNPRHRSYFVRNIPFMSGSGAKFTYHVFNRYGCMHDGVCTSEKAMYHKDCHPSMPVIHLNSHMKCCGHKRFARVQSLLMKYKNINDLAVLSGDEFCSVNGTKEDSPYAFRQYYDPRLVAPSGDTESSLPEYLPLGPRHEFSFVDPTTAMTSEHDLVLNFIGSPTNPVRLDMLAAVQLAVDNNVVFENQTLVHIADTWAKRFTKKTGHVTPVNYQQVLLRSTFTLCPDGHNAEAYRIYEAIEAGSIPVLQRNPIQTGGPDGTCRDALRPFLDSNSPLPFLEKWSDLPAFLEQARDDPTFAPRLREKVVAWYRAYMRSSADSLEIELEKAWRERLSRTRRVYNHTEVKNWLASRQPKKPEQLREEATLQQEVIDELQKEKDDYENESRARIAALAEFWGVAPLAAPRNASAPEAVAQSIAKQVAAKLAALRTSQARTETNTWKHMRQVHPAKGRKTPLSAKHVCVVPDVVEDAWEFASDNVRFFGSNSFTYRIEKICPDCDPNAVPEACGSADVATIRLIRSPLLSSPPKGYEMRKFHMMKREAWKTFDVVVLVGDDHCARTGSPTAIVPEVHFRQFYSASASRLFDYDDVFLSRQPFWLPLGLPHGFERIITRDLLPMAKRKLLYSFVGSGTASTARKALVKLHSERWSKFELGSGELVKRGRFETPLGKARLSMSEYRSVLLNSKLVLAPRGRSFETHRLSEAVYAGAIPVIGLGAVYQDTLCVDSLRPFRDAPFFYIEEGWSKESLDNLLTNVVPVDKLEQRAANATQFLHDLGTRQALLLETVLARRWAARLSKRSEGASGAFPTAAADERESVQHSIPVEAPSGLESGEEEGESDGAEIERE